MTTFNQHDWYPKKRDQVRCTKTTDYFVKGEVYTVAKARKKGFVGFHVFSLGYPVLTHIDSFERVTR